MATSAALTVWKSLLMADIFPLVTWKLASFGYLDYTKTLLHRADAIVVGYIGSVGRVVIPIGVHSACSRSEVSVLHLGEVHLEIEPSLFGGIEPIPFEDD